MWYLLKRGLQMLVILAILSAALFGLLSSMPGNPIDLLITSNPNVKPEDVVRLKRLRGLDKPWYVQYVRWIVGYPEPARPPVVLPLPSIEASGTIPAEINLGDYLVDPNYVPNMASISQWLAKIWPDWQRSKDSAVIEDALKAEDISAILLAVATHDTEKQNQLVRLIEKESAKTLQVDGLFGTRVQGLTLIIDNVKNTEPHRWLKVTNSYGQEKVMRVTINSGGAGPTDIMAPISTLLVENDDKPYTVDLKKFLVNVSDKEDAQFSLLADEEGPLSNDGVYTNKFAASGQTVVQAQIKTAKGEEKFAFDIEHGVVGHDNKYNRGFLYFFLGDQNALGFSQTYKRPVYDLLFGTPPICGDGKIDSGETCDDGNREPNDGCGVNCFRDGDTIVQKADASFSGYIVSSGRIGNTIQLMFPALILSLLIAIPLGVFSAYRQYSWADYIINFLAFIGISLPVFWFGIMMIYVFAENFQFFPAGGVQTPGIYGQGSGAIVWDRLQHAVLPTIVLSIFYVGRWLRYMRASMLEVLPKDYIRTARAKGLSERAVILKHAFRNALIPVVTVLALSIPSLFGGAVLTETVFSWPGVGRLQYDAVMNSDYYVAIIVFLIEAILVMVGNLLADAVYVAVDPRIRKG